MGCFGGDETKTTTVTTPAATTDETSINASNAEIAKMQAQLFPLLMAYQFPELALSGESQGLTLSPTLKKQLEEMVATSTSDKELSRLTSEQLRKYLAGESTLTPGQETQVNTLYGNERTLGQQEILRANQALSASKGLNMSDSPSANEMLRQIKNLELGLGSAKASTMLNFGNMNSAFSQARQNYQNALNQSSTTNRLNLATAAPSSIGISQLLANQRLNQPTTTTTANTSTLNQMGGLGGVGSLLGGMSDLYGTKFWV